MNDPTLGNDARAEDGEGGGSNTLDALKALVLDVDEALAGVAPHALDDDDLVLLVSVVERLGRSVDAARVASAGEVGERCRPERGEARLSARRGCRNASELLQRLTGVNTQTVSRRLGLGRETYRRLSLAGHEAPARFPAVAAGLAEGSLSVDAAIVIVRGLSAVVDRAPGDLWLGAEAELVAAAPEVTADETRFQVGVWCAVLDPDGAEPSEERSMRRRALRVSADAEGMVRVSGVLMPTAGAQLAKLLDAYLTPRTQPAFLSREERDGVDAGKDPRSRDQQRHDIFAGLVDSAARSAETATIGGAAPTVLVTISDTEWKKADTGGLTGAGVGAVEGVQVPVSLRVVRQYACTGGVQPVVLNAEGALVALGSPQRCFTAQQRRAITVRDGGCLIPGCMVPASWCEIHHVTEASAGGPTHPSNGVLLCWFHHRSINTSGWQVRMKGGVPQVKKPAWLASDATWQPSTKSLTRQLETTQYKTRTQPQPRPHKT